MGAGSRGEGEGRGATQIVHTAPSACTLWEQGIGKTNTNSAEDEAKTSAHFHLPRVDHPARVSAPGVNIVVWFRSAPRRRNCCPW